MSRVRFEYSLAGELPASQKIQVRLSIRDFEAVERVAAEHGVPLATACRALIRTALPEVAA